MDMICYLSASMMAIENENLARIVTKVKEKQERVIASL
jgi:hypothetical protein